MRLEDDDILASTLYRLVDSDKSMQRQHFSIEDMKKCVIRDVENLLNTRGQIFSIPDAYKETKDSLLSYGIKDFTSQNPRSSFVRQELRSDIENAIKQFEPRLENLSVILEESKQGKRELVFRINALLVADPAVEQISFDTYFDMNNGEYRVST